MHEVNQATPLANLSSVTAPPHSLTDWAIRANAPEFMTLEEAGTNSTLSVRSLWTAIQNGSLAVLRPRGRSGRGGRVIVQKASLLAFLQGRSEPARASKNKKQSPEVPGV